jgi:hypothetical protein
LKAVFSICDHCTGHRRQALLNVRFAPDSDQKADIAEGPSCADFVAKVIDGFCAE